MADYDLQYQDTYIDALLATANELKTAGYIYKGVATPSTNPGTPSERMAYLASEPGTYTNFGGIVITSGLYSLTYAGGTWTGTQMQAGSDIEVVQTTGQSASDVMSQKAVTDIASISGSITATWYQGTLENEHYYNGSGAMYALRIICAIPAATHMTFVVANGYSISIHEYSAVYNNPTGIAYGNSWISTLGTWNEGTLEYTPSALCKTIVVVMRKGNGSTNIAPSEGSNMTGLYYYSLHDNAKITDEILYGATINGGACYPNWYQGTLSDSMHAYTTEGVNAPRRIICAVPYTPQLTVVVTSGYWASIHEYSEIYGSADLITGGNAWLGNTHGWFDGSLNITPLANTKTFAIVMSKGNKAQNVTPVDGRYISFSTQGYSIDGLIKDVRDLAYYDSDSYVWRADLIKQKCRTTLLGSLSYIQAFCQYDGKYYSTNGSKIAEQDSTFAVLRDVSINVGHGNSLQLVGSGKAWASGWDDQKMYKVNLSTLSVESTITLPTTGYTTAAVDEENGLMYIFQRDTDPNYIGQYTFIVYDYINSQVKSTRKIESFAAMQSVDYYEGKILMLYGLSTSTAPSGMRVYNTAGDILVTYDLQIFRTVEPEGIMFTRDTFELLVSDVNKRIFKVT